MAQDEKKKDDVVTVSQEVTEVDVPTDVAATETDTEPQTPKGRARLNERMRAALGDSYKDDDDDGNADAYMGYLDKREDADKRLADALSKDPRLAALIGDLLRGKRGAGAAAMRYFGRDLLTAEEGTPEYDEINAAEEERLKEAADLATAEEEYMANIERTMPIVEEFCRKNNKDLEDFKDQLWNKIVLPVLSGDYSEELCQIVLNGLDYDQDIADATEAGKVMGRNENIERHREHREAGAMTTGFGGANIPSTRAARPKVQRDLAFLAAEQA